MNPAVTLAFAVTRSFSWKKVPIYWYSHFYKIPTISIMKTFEIQIRRLAQYLGSLAASGTVLGIYYGLCQQNSPKLFALL